MKKVELMKWEKSSTFVISDVVCRTNNCIIFNMLAMNVCTTKCVSLIELAVVRFHFIACSCILWCFLMHSRITACANCAIATNIIYKQIQRIFVAKREMENLSKIYISLCTVSRVVFVVNVANFPADENCVYRSIDSQ